MVVLTKFYADIKVHPLPDLWNLSSNSLWSSVFLEAYDVCILFGCIAVSSSSWFIVFHILTLNVGTFGFGSEVDFSNTRAISTGYVPCCLSRRAMQFGSLIWIWVMEIFQWLFLINRRDSYRRLAVVFWASTCFASHLPYCIPWFPMFSLFFSFFLSLSLYIYICIYNFLCL